jgi:hypothetical protein
MFTQHSTVKSPVPNANAVFGGTYRDDELDPMKYADVGDHLACVVDACAVPVLSILFLAAASYIPALVKFNNKLVPEIAVSGVVGGVNADV